jgi:AraC-like DNA-binding protein
MASTDFRLSGNPQQADSSNFENLFLGRRIRRRHVSVEGDSRTLYDPRNGDPALSVADLEAPPGEFEPPRTNRFSVYWILEGSGECQADGGRHAFGPNSLLFFVPYQYVRLAPEAPMQGAVVQFHANFLCIETYHAEIGCNGVLFNDPYGVPLVRLDGAAAAEAADLIARIRRELAEAGVAHAEVLLSYLKVLLVLATRSKLRQGTCDAGARLLPTELERLAELVEANYRRLHSPADYAALLHVTPKTLGRLVRKWLGKTPTDLIRDRILKHAKWELLHTLRPVKEIARELGYDDELYFSRLFKRATGYSPTFFREFETEIRGGANLSMPSTPPSIPPRSVGVEDSL